MCSCLLLSFQVMTTSINRIPYHTIFPHIITVPCDVTDDLIFDKLYYRQDWFPDPALVMYALVECTVVCFLAALSVCYWLVLHGPSSGTGTGHSIFWYFVQAILDVSGFRSCLIHIRRITWNRDSIDYTLFEQQLLLLWMWTHRCLFPATAHASHENPG